MLSFNTPPPQEELEEAVGRLESLERRLDTVEQEARDKARMAKRAKAQLDERAQRIARLEEELEEALTACEAMEREAKVR